MSSPAKLPSQEVRNTLATILEQAEDVRDALFELCDDEN